MPPITYTPTMRAVCYHTKIQAHHNPFNSNERYPCVEVVARAHPGLPIQRVSGSQVMHVAAHREGENGVGAHLRQLHTEVPVE